MRSVILVSLIIDLCSCDNELTNPSPHFYSEFGSLKGVAELFGYLLPWSYIRQLETIWGMAKPSPSHAGDPSLSALGAAIRERRAKLGLSQEDLAFKADLDRSYIGGIERGEHNLSLINLCRIAQSLDLSATKLLGLANL